MQLFGSLSILWHCLSLGLEWKLTFSSPVASAESSKFAGVLSAAFSQHHLLGFEIALLEFHQLHLFIVMLPKAHLTSHSRMSGSRWVITPSWISGSWRSFLYSSSVYSYHFFSILSASVRFIPFLSFIMPFFAWNVPSVCWIFLKRSLVVPILLFFSFFALIAEERLIEHQERCGAIPLSQPLAASHGETSWVVIATFLVQERELGFWSQITLFWLPIHLHSMHMCVAVVFTTKIIMMVWSLT